MRINQAYYYYCNNYNRRMMKPILILTSALILTSCGAPKFINSSVSSKEVVKLNYFEPFSYIQHIEKGNQSKFSDSLSFLTKTRLDSLLNKNKSTLRLHERIDLSDSELRTRVENEIGYLAQIIGQRKKLEGIPLTLAIDSIMESNNQRFALATVATGFGRRKGNYGGQVGKGAAIGVLTLGMYAPIPVKSNLTLYSFIFDSEKNVVAFFKKALPVEKEPTDPEIIEKQLMSLFNGYFYVKK